MILTDVKWASIILYIYRNKKHLKNVGPIRHCEPPHALILHCHSPGVATVARRLRIDVHHNDKDNAWQRGPLWPHRMGPIIVFKHVLIDWFDRLSFAGARNGDLPTVLALINVKFFTPITSLVLQVSQYSGIVTTIEDYSRIISKTRPRYLMLAK